MRDEDITNMEIAEKLEVSLTTLQYWRNKLNLEKRARGAFINWMRYRNRLIRLLKRNGPIPRREAMRPWD